MADQDTKAAEAPPPSVRVNQNAPGAAARPPAGGPAPDSIASESASSVPGSAAEAAFSLEVTREILAAGRRTPGLYPLAEPAAYVFPVVDDDYA